MDESDVPRWSPDDHLQRVYQRGRVLRRRRLAVLTGLPAAAVVLVVALLVSSGGSGAPHGLRTLAGPVPSKSSAVTDTSADSSSTLPAAGGGASTSTTTTGGGAGHRATTSTSRPAAGGGSTTTVAQSSTTTSVVAACAASDLDYSTVVDRASYAKGQTVTISLVVRNHSNRTCEGPGRCGIGPWASVEDSGGAQVWRNNPIAISCVNPPPPPPQLAPGASATYQAAAWDQKTCPDQSNCTNKQAPPGTYRAIAHRGDVTAPATSFVLTG